MAPGGTVSRTVFDTLGRMSSQWFGTDDTHQRQLVAPQQQRGQRDQGGPVRIRRWRCLITSHPPLISSRWSISHPAHLVTPVLPPCRARRYTAVDDRGPQVVVGSVGRRVMRGLGLARRARGRSHSQGVPPVALIPSISLTTVAIRGLLPRVQ